MAREQSEAAIRRVAIAPQNRGIEPLVPWLIAAIAISGLYFGQSMLIPITLSVFLSFLLAPIVATLRNLKLTRPGAVLLTITLALAGFLAISTVLISQASTLSKDAPLYAERIAAKATAVRTDLRHKMGALVRESGDGGSGHRQARYARQEGARDIAVPTSNDALPVEVREAPLTAIEEVQAYLIPALAPVETALIVLIVTVFILFQKEDLRDRLIRLMGIGDLHRTTLALDEGAKRLSRYFLSQFMVNCGFGTVIWIGLFLLGVPSPGLWGILAGLMRFVPYFGPLIAALGPLMLAAAVDPGWHMVMWVALLFIVVEPTVGYVVEPLLYGHSTGLSPVSVIIAALFWTWIWGAIGLVLSMPLTLVLVSLGRHLPGFAIFDILLGDRPALSPAETFYQRALAGHPDEAIEQAEDALESRTLAEYYDEVVLGGLRLAAADVDRGAIKRSALHSICETTLEVLAALADYQDVAKTPTQPPQIKSTEQTLASVQDKRELSGCRIVCFPGRGPLDGAVAVMMSQLLRVAGCEVYNQSRDPLAQNVYAKIGDTADAICILGLFDERSFRRIQHVLQTEDKVTFVGVRRKDDIVASDVAQSLHPSLSAILDTLRATRLHV